VRVETSYGEGTLARYAAGIEVNYATLSEHRRVAALYEIPCRQGISFTVALVLAAQPIVDKRARRRPCER